MNKQIAILIPYFGKWPEWIDLYLYSCTQNNHIDWLFFTDCPIPSKPYKNIFFFSISFQGYCNDISNKLKIKFKPENPYKLCDLKPFYGFLHSDLIKDYAFWGFGDIDIIWGNIAKYYSLELFNHYDVFSTHADRISGHLAIFRNISKYTELAFQIADWKNKLESSKHFALDENDFSHLIYPESRYIKKVYSKIIRKLFNWRDAWVLYYHILPVFNSLFRLKPRRLYFKEQHTTPILGSDNRSFKYDSDTWYYKDGKIINGKTKNECIYLHFMIYKKNNLRNDYFWHSDFYKIEPNYDLKSGVKISEKGFESGNEK